MNAYQQFVACLVAHGCTVDDKGDHGSASTPGHSSADRATTFRRTDNGVVVFVHNGDTGQVLAELGLTFADLYDEPRTAYRYSDGRTVTRSYREGKKTFTQAGNKTGAALFGIEDLPADMDASVYVVEGEQDVIAARTVGVCAVSQAQGANTAPDKADWSALGGRPVIVVQDKDEPGRQRAEKVARHLADTARSVTVAQAKDGKDFADHVAAGHAAADLVTIGQQRARRRLTVTRGSQVKAKRVRWVVPDWIPAGSLTLIAGREGLGKSTIAAGYCAQITTGTLEGGEWAGQARTVVYIHTEDSREFTVAPRLRAAGADMDRVLFLDVQTETTDTGMVVLPLDTEALEQVIVKHDVTFVVLDAATSTMASELSGKDDRAVRQYLEPLAQLAARQGCVILGLCHFGKRDGADTGKLILGSIAWSQVARSVLSVARDDESGRLIVTNTKANLAPRIRSMEAEIVSVPVATEDGDTEVGVLRWLGESERDARDLLAAEAVDNAQARSEAEHWLLDYLTQQGRAASKQVKDQARRQGFSERTVSRAATTLGVVSESAGFPRTTHWSLPAQSGHPQPRTPIGGVTGATGLDLAKQGGVTDDRMQLRHTADSGVTIDSVELASSSRGDEPADDADHCPVCHQAHEVIALDSTMLCRACTRSGLYLTHCAVCMHPLPRKFALDRHHACRTQRTA